MTYAALNGNQIVSAQITIPMRGIWTADVMLEQEPETSLTGLLSLTIGESFTMRGTIVRSGEFVGTFSARLVGGYAGWRTVLAPRSYRSPLGLRLSPILRDAAREAGEQINVADDRTLQSFYVRPRGRASRVLTDLYPDWWIDFDGVTQIAERVSGVVGSSFDVIGYDPHVGKIEVATDAPQAFVPGVSFSDVTLAQKTANLVVHHVKAEKLRTVVYA